MKFVETTKKPFNRELAETLIPTLMYIEVVMNLGRILLLLVSIKYLNIGKVYYVYHMVYFMVRNTYPDDFGDYRLQFCLAWGYVFYLSFVTDFIPGALLSVGGQVYLTFLVEPCIYGKQVLVGQFLIRTVIQIIILILIHIFLQLVGNIFIEAEVLR